MRPNLLLPKPKSDLRLKEKTAADAPAAVFFVKIYPAYSLPDLFRIR